VSLDKFKPNLIKANEIFVGKEEVLDLAICCLLSGGHLLLEDVPGVGKTTLVKLIAKIFNLKLSRVQFTNDLLPSDILGAMIFNQQTNEFEFKQGPVFGEIILADELNRAPPKTQSALLQAMEEKEISVDGHHEKLPKPFLVMATQNPMAQLGTFPLPESQIDRFLMKLNIGFPDKQFEIELLKGKARDELINKMESALTKEDLLQIQSESQKKVIAEPIYEYIEELLTSSRQLSELIPLSPRAGIDLIKVLKSWMYIKKIDHVTPEHIQYLVPFIWGHRLVPTDVANIEMEFKASKKLIESTAVK
jgi:MoxR-like ATPase